jgi:hypothetical protein
MNLRTLIASLSIGLVIVGSSGRVMAKPASLFNPVIGEIKENLPRGMVMRLPSSIELRGWKNQRVPLHPRLEKREDGLSISLSAEQNCKAHYCYMGSASVSRIASSNEKSRAEVINAPITLRSGIRGTYTAVRFGDGPMGFVNWQQDGLNYSLALRIKMIDSQHEEPADRKRIIEAAISMAKETPITITGEE